MIPPPNKRSTILVSGGVVIVISVKLYVVKSMAVERVAALLVAATFVAARTLTPSYQHALVKYQKAVEPRLREACTIKRRDELRAQHELEKVRRKAGSGKHIQKNGVIYKRWALNQIVERNEEEQVYRDSIRNTAVQRKVATANKEWKKLITNLDRKVEEWKKNAKKAY